MSGTSYKTTMLRAVTVTALSLLLPLAMAAQQIRIYRESGFWVEEISGALPASPRISVHLPQGSIVIRGGKQSNITYTLIKRVPADEALARRLFEGFRFTAYKAGDTATLDGSFSGGHFMYMAELLVQAPESVEAVRLFTHGGNESVVGIHGRVDAATAGGNIYLDQLAGPVSASSAGGNVDVGTVGGDLTVKTGGGNVRIASVKGRIATFTGGGNVVIGSGQVIRVQTGGGQIQVGHCAGELVANTGGGSLDLGQIAGKADLQSAGGSIRMLAANGPVIANTAGGTIELYGMTHGADVQTGSGPIIAEFLGGDFTGSSLQTPSGDIIVYLGPSLKATIHAAIDYANGHRIRSDFPQLKVNVEGGPFGPRSIFAQGNLNGGGPILRVRATDGNIELRRIRK